MGYTVSQLAEEYSKAVQFIFNKSQLVSIHHSEISYIKGFTFYSCSKLLRVTFPNCTVISSRAFMYCYSLSSISFPSCTTIGHRAFEYCSALTSILFPNCTHISDYAFAYCPNIWQASFPNCTTINSSAFFNCIALTTIYIGISKPVVCTLADSAVFSNTGIKSNAGTIWVPASLKGSYQTATGWVYFSKRINGAA